MGELNKIVFLDRDGTLNVEKNYVHTIQDFEFIPGTAEALIRLKKAEYKSIVVSNQSGVSRGYYTMEDVRKLERHIRQSLNEMNTSIDAFLYCPHHPDGKVVPYNVVCSCRKPKTGMFEQAAAMFSIDLKNSWMIGDSIADMNFGLNAGLNTILVRTGYGSETKKLIGDLSLKINAIVDDFLAAVMYITSSKHV